MNATEPAPKVRRVPNETLMRGSFYADSTYCHTDVGQGVTRNRAGTRLIALSADFLLGFRRAIMDECGPAAGTVFKTCGHKWGVMLAHRFSKEMTDFYGKPVAEFKLALFQACVVEMFNHHGWGLLTLDLAHHDQGLLVIQLANPVMASLVEREEQPVETLMAGILAGFFGQLSGQDLDCVQTACQSHGAATSKFVVGLAARLAPVAAWVENGKSHDHVVAELASVRG